MQKTLLILTFSLFSLLHAGQITCSKESYSIHEQISVNLKDMEGNSKDWIAIYPANASNEWKNVIYWKWTNGVTNHKIVFKRVPKGKYEVRSFLNNTYTLEASDQFEVKDQYSLPPSELLSQRSSYDEYADIFIDAKGMWGSNRDWIALYKAGTSNAWENVLLWQWTKGKIENHFKFKGLPKGEYEARIFYNNTYKMEGLTSFSVNDFNSIPARINTRKKVYQVNEPIVVGVSDMLGDPEDWVAIFPKNSISNWANVIKWKKSGGKKGATLLFEGLDVGEYEVRAFFRNSYHVEAKISFTVTTSTYSGDDRVVDYVRDVYINRIADKNILFLEEFGIAYFRKKDENIHEEVLYAINIEGDWSRIGETYFEYSSKPQIIKLENTPLLMVKTSQAHSDSYGFYYTDREKGRVSKLLEYYKYHDWFLDRIETTESGTKLSIKAHHNGSGEIYHKIYDLTNLPEITEIN